MKVRALPIVWFTTLFLIVFVILSVVNTSLSVLIPMVGFSFFLIPFMVYIVLKDDYKTTKTFSDWYEDHPRKNFGA